MGKAQGFLVMLYRVGGAAHAVAPPVVHCPAIYRCLRRLFPNPLIEFLQRHHMQGYFLPEAPVKSIHCSDNGGIGRCIVGEYAADASDIEIIRIAALLVFPDAAAQPGMEGFQGRALPRFPEVIFRYGIHILVKYDTQGIAQVVVFPAPHQQPLPLIVFPEKGLLVLIERIHAMVGMNIGKQKFHAVFYQHIPCPQGNTIDIRIHGRLHGYSPGPKDFLHFRGFPIQHFRVRQVRAV